MIAFNDPAVILADIEDGITQAGGVIGRDYRVEGNRYAAIKSALELARPSDLVIVAGKGHENHWVIGDEKIPFNDEQVISALLAGRKPPLNAVNYAIPAPLSLIAQ